MTKQKSGIGQTTGRFQKRTKGLHCLIRWIGLISLIILACTQPPAFVVASEDPRDHLYKLINQVRLYEGLAPLGKSILLGQAAQRHAEDLVTLGKVTHKGSDGSTYQQRIREAHYQAWNDGLLVNEVLWAGLGTAEDALVWFHNNPEWGLLMDSRYREIGIGYADDNGVHYFVVNLGSRPGVLPIFINDGAETTDSPQVALRLTNEEAVPMGGGTWIGKAIEVRLNNTPSFEGLSWEPWESLLPWQLSGDTPGEYAVYAQFRDGAGRTTISEDTIRLVAPGAAPPPPTPPLDLLQVTPAPQATLVPPEQGTSVPTVTEVTPIASPTVSPTEFAPTSSATVPVSPIPEAFPTWTPLPSIAITTKHTNVDWPLLSALALQAIALILGIIAFLRQH